MKTNKEQQIDIWLQNLSNDLAKLILEFLIKLAIASELEKGSKMLRMTGDRLHELVDNDNSNVILRELENKGIVHAEEALLTSEEISYLKQEKLWGTIGVIEDVQLGELFDYVLSSLKKRFEVTKGFYRYDYSSKTFSLRLKGGNWESINFTTKRNKKYQSTLFEILLEHWERNSSPIPIPKKDVIIEVSKRLKESLREDWLHDTLRHLKDKIDNPRLKGYVILKQGAHVSDSRRSETLIFRIIDPAT